MLLLKNSKRFINAGVFLIKMVGERREFFGSDSWVQDLTALALDADKTLILKRKGENGISAVITLSINDLRKKIGARGLVLSGNQILQSDEQIFQGHDCLQQALTYRGERIIDYDRRYFGEQ